MSTGIELCAKCLRSETVYILNNDIKLCEQCFHLEVQFGVDNTEHCNLQSMGFCNGTTTVSEL